MKIQLDQLTTQIKKNISPLYLITGDEILLSQEAEQTIRSAAAAAGFEERIGFTVDSGFDWLLFQKATQNASIFSEKQYISLNLTSGKITEAGKKILLNYLQRIDADKILVIRMGKADAAMQKTAWYKAADTVGVIIPVWPLSAAQMPAWIKQRLAAVGLQADSAGLQLLALYTEGNLLATAQTIEKLNLLYPAGRLSVVQIEEAMSNHARYNVFHLVDTILQGNPASVVHVLNGLKEEAAEPILILWALTREIRQWIQWLQAIENGQTLVQLLGNNFMLKKRIPSITQALQKQSLGNLYAGLQAAANIDKTIKGAAVGNVWDALAKLSLSLTGCPRCV